jgi:hypothetical protein
LAGQAASVRCLSVGDATANPRSHCRPPRHRFASPLQMAQTFFRHLESGLLIFLPLWCMEIAG